MDKDLEQMRKDARCLAADGVADQNDVEHVENSISQYYVGACKTLVSSRKWFFNYKSHDEMTERYDQWENLFVQLARERPHVLKTSLWTAIERLYNKHKFPLSNVKNDGFAMKQLLINLVHKAQVCTNGVRQPIVIKKNACCYRGRPSSAQQRSSRFADISNRAGSCTCSSEKDIYEDFSVAVGQSVSRACHAAAVLWSTRSYVGANASRKKRAQDDVARPAP